jgi:glycosyltransferase involved in cell wall biosynthesis
LRALHIIPGLDRNHGGPSYSVPRICAALRKQGVETHIHTVRGTNTPSDPFISAHRQDFANIPLLRSLRLSFGLTRGALIEVSTSDIIHTHGLWLMPNVNAGQVAAKAKRPLLVSPRGMLAPEALAFSTRRKQLFWRFLQGPAYAHAVVWHATSAAEAGDIRNFGVRSPIAVIPNGIDLPADSGARTPRAGQQHNILYLGRLHHIKGLPNLITAWSQVANERPDWALRIIGPDEGGHRAQLERLVQEQGVSRVIFDGPVYGVEKSLALRNADLFVLPTQNENFGIAVAEALASGIPAIVSRGAPWAGLETKRCGWWVERGIEPLVNALRESTTLSDDERRVMGERGRALVAREYDWDKIADDMRSVYEWVLGRIERPSMVHLD